MTTGWLTWTCLLLAAGSTGADDVVYMNQRGFQIPIRIQPERQNEVRELILYLSRDQGKTWEIYNRAMPTSKEFDFFASADGLLYFSVAVTDKRGVQDPPDIYKAPVGQKICIDTTKPVVRSLRVERAAPDEIQVSWEVQEERPDWTSFRLEWRPTEYSAGPWTPLPVQPSERGNHRFKVVSTGDVQVRLTMRDLAGNEVKEEKVLPGGRQDHLLSRVRNDELPPPLPPPGTGITPPHPSAPMMGTTPSTVGSSNTPMPHSVVETPLPAPISSSASSASTTAPMPSRGALTPLRIVNQRQVKLGFDVARFGPSGLGTVDVYVTGDEGATWEKQLGDPVVSLPVSPEMHGQTPVKGTVTVQLPSEGKIYGFYLVVKSRAGLSKPAPRPGEAPQVRLECDTTQPSAYLYAPQPDPARPTSLVLTWKAEDRNLAPNPVSLEWSDKPTGPWEFIGDAQLPNTGRYTWQVPTKIPPKVYLKLTVRDTAGNVAVAQTGEPVLIDLTVPEVGGVEVIGR